MSKDNKQHNDKKTHQPRREEPFLKVPYWLARKAGEEHITFKQLLTYSWLYTKNCYARNRHGGVYGKRTYRDLNKEIENDLGIYDVGDLCRALERAAWIQKSPAIEYGGKRQVGYLCLLSAEQKLEARAAQQEAAVADEEAVVVVESSVPANGEYTYGGIRFYDDPDGNPHQVPSSAPLRPTPTAIWCNDPEGWYEPNDLPSPDPAEPLPY